MFSVDSMEITFWALIANCLSPKKKISRFIYHPPYLVGSFIIPFTIGNENKKIGEELRRQNQKK